jgi:glycosyltransferase involved in cell wall biosynthesis
MLPVLSIIVPCYQEEAVLPKTSSSLTHLLKEMIDKNQISPKSFVLLIDNGSDDNTWQIIQEKSKENLVKGIKIPMNVGHQNGLYAGFEYVQDLCDCVVSIDADLQDDEQAIKEMISLYKQGNQVVYGVRDDRTTDSKFKRFTAEFFYKIMIFMGVKMVFNHADYRLMSRVALKNFLQFNERNVFIRGIVPLLGLQSANVYYKRKERMAGESKYSVRKLLSFAWEGVTSFSIVPLKMITAIGFMIFLISVIMGAYTLYIALFTDRAIQGWASTTLPIYFIGGIQILSIGIIGEYIGKIYKETKHRPRYFIEKTTDDE